MKVAIFASRDIRYGEEDYSNAQILTQQLTNWIELPDTDYEALKIGIQRQQYYNGEYLIVVRQIDLEHKPDKLSIESIITSGKKYLEQIKKQQNDRKKKELKSQKQKEERKKEKELKKLQELKAKYES